MLTAVGLLVLGGCVGEIGDRAGVGDDSAPLTCDDNTRPSASDLRRLTAQQYQNAVVDLFASVATLDVPLLAADAFSRLPADGTQTENYTRMDARLSPPHVDAYFDVADVIARELEVQPEARAALVGDCANDASLTDECVDAFLDRFAWRAFRRPLEPDERDRFHAMNDGTHAGPEMVRGLVFAALMSPQFLYQVEVLGPSIEGDDRFTLDAYALASRLSFHFWNSMPDEQLFAAAADGSLLTDEGYRAEVDRIFDDPRTRALSESFYREWLRYDQVGGLKSTVVFEAFAADPAIVADGPALVSSMQEEVDALARYYTWEVDGDFRDLLVSDLSLTSSELLASLYGVPPWDGEGEPPTFSPDQRSGLLTRAAFLLTGSHDTNPVLRGAVVRRRILCQEMVQPSPSSLPPGSLDPPEFSIEMTTRQRYEEKTKNEPCASCHAQMNPIGFVLERYDALGRYRTKERILDTVTGEELAQLEIDTTAVPELTPDDTSPVSEAADLMERVAATGRVEACFARNYFQFSYGRELVSDDDCTVGRIEQALVGEDAPGSLRAALRAIALDPAFRQRVVGPREQE